MNLLNKNYKFYFLVIALLLLSMFIFICGCYTDNQSTDTDKLQTDVNSHIPIKIDKLNILGDELIYLTVGETYQIATDAPESVLSSLIWTSSSPYVYVSKSGQIRAQALGEAVITVEYGIFYDTITVSVVDDITKTPENEQGTDTAPNESQTDTSLPSDKPNDKPNDTPPVIVPPSNLPDLEIYEALNSPLGYKPAESYNDALNRTENGELSGYPYVPDQAPIISEYRPMQDNMYVRNNKSYYIDNNTYVVIDVYGREVFRIYRGGAYITLEEVAAYVYAFGTFPANHSSSKKTSPTSSIWGEYLRVNHTKFSGSTSKYPYEPELPRISGCGGDLTYYEMDIGTTGNDCDPSYPSTIYNNGSKITRGASRIVYTWNDLNYNGINDGNDIVYVFYTYNHYNDFQEYLNYYGGWGEMFGNITGGGTISSKYDYNPTPYVPTANGDVTSFITTVEVVYYCDIRKYFLNIA